MGDGVRCKMRKSGSSIADGWGALDIDTLSSIFSYLPSSDLILSVSLVCNSWRLGCWETLFWQKSVFDLGCLESAFRKSNLKTWNETGHHPLSFDFMGLETEYMTVMKATQNMLISIMESGGSYSKSWLQSVREIRIPHKFHIMDDHLVYLAQRPLSSYAKYLLIVDRTPAVENLYLLGSASITRRGFAYALLHWKQIKNITLGEVYFSDHYDLIEDSTSICSGISKIEIRCPLHDTKHRAKPVTVKNLPLVKTTRTDCCCSFGGLK